MLQTGTYHVYEVKDNQRVISPIANAFIYFIADGAIKLKTQTDDKGKYSFDLPLGEYTVASASEGGIEQLLANGSKFILNAQSKVTAFEEWVNAPSADVDTALLKRFKELAKIAEDAAREANEVLAQLEGNSIGTGSWVRESILNKYISKSMPRSDQGWFAIKAVDSGGAVLNFECATGFVRGNIIVSKDDGISFRQFKEGDPLPISWNMPLKSGRLAIDSDVQKKMDSYAFGLGKPARNIFASGAGFFSQEVVTDFNYMYGITLTSEHNDKAVSNIFSDHTRAGYFGFRSVDGFDRYSTGHFMTTYNTVTDSNGFLKAASPVLKLFNDRIETNDQFIEEPIFERISEGTYKISSTLGLAQEGWTYEKPRGSDGNPYFRVLVKKTEDGCIISVHDEYDSIEEATITDIDGNTRKINKVVKVLSQARDIKPHERWIDLRFHEEPREEIEPSEVVQ